MKKSIILLAMVAIAFSCSKGTLIVKSEVNEETQESGEYILSFTATSEMTKTMLKEDRSVWFKANEEIAVFASNGEKYKYKTLAGGANAVFVAEGAAAPAGNSPYYAVCPYTAADDATLDAEQGKINGIVIGVNNEGTAKGTYNSKKAVCVAKSNNTEFTFKQLTALLKIVVPSEISINKIVVYNRDNGGGNTAGAITGTLSVSPKLSGDAPTVTVTAPTFKTGMIGPSGSSTALEAGVYYIPILPAQLTDKKGLEIEYQNASGDVIGHAFNGNAIKFARAKVYNLGTASLSSEYVYTGFEDQNLTGFTAGSEGQLSVVENNLGEDGNTSSYILKDYKDGSDGTSGYFDIQTGNDYGYRKFPSTVVRSYYDKIRIKIYLGSNEYYPRLKRGSNTARLPDKINGTSYDGTNWNALISTSAWNTLEWNASSLDVGWSDFSNLQQIQLRPMVDISGNNISGSDPTTNNRTVYIDDITFVQK